MVALIFRTLQSFLVFDVVYIMTSGGPGTATNVLAYLDWKAFLVATDFGYGGAVSVALVAFALIIAADLHPGLPNRAAGMSALVKGAGAAGGRLAVVRRRPAAQRRTVKRAGFGLLMTLFVLASMFPFYWIVITSLKTQSEVNQGTTSLLPGHITWSNYITDFTKEDFIRPLLNSAVVALSTTILTVVIASLAGYALARTQMRGKTR